MSKEPITTLLCQMSDC